MSKLEEILDEAMDRQMDAMVTPETLHEHFPHLIKALDQRDLHHTQVAAVVETWQKLVGAGERPSLALQTACQMVGEPGKKRIEVWDERFRRYDF